MNNMDMNGGAVETELPQHAVSLYGQNEGVDDFPVLKAFQQYIDAEQEKARKRIIGLGIFFGAILIVVVVVFMILLNGISTRNQALSDRLVEYAMKEADRRQQVMPAAYPVPQNDAMLKAMTETLSALQKNIETNAKDVGRRQNENALRDIAAREDSVRLQRARAQLESEKKLLAEERERLRQIEIEQQRRKLYPELYDDMKNREESPSRRRSLTDEDIREIIREAYPESELRSLRSTSGSANKRNERGERETSESDDAIEYFKDDDYTIPVDVKGSSSKVRFTIPVE